MILTRSELAKMAELFDAQELPDTFPDDLEFFLPGSPGPDNDLEGLSRHAGTGAAQMVD